jgi:hypothetical protein
MAAATSSAAAVPFGMPFKHLDRKLCFGDFRPMPKAPKARGLNEASLSALDLAPMQPQDLMRPFQEGQPDSVCKRTRAGINYSSVMASPHSL